MKAIVIIFITLSYTIFAQDTTSNNTKKLFYSFHFGLNYKTFLDGNYIKPTAYKEGEEFIDHQFDGYNKIPTFGFNIGFHISKKISNKWNIVSGVDYFYKKNIFEKNADIVKKTGVASGLRVIDNVIKYNYTYNNLEIPLLIQYAANNFFVSSGLNVSVLTYKIAKYKYIVINPDNYTPNNWLTDEKNINKFHAPLQLYPTISTGYKLKRKSIVIWPYLAFYYAFNQQNDFYSQFGIKIPITKN